MRRRWHGEVPQRWSVCSFSASSSSAPLWATDATEPYREGPAWRALLPVGAAVARFEALERLPAGDEAPADAATGRASTWPISPPRQGLSSA